ncbi:spore coat protein CotJB [Clostridiales bacterium BAD-6]|uniref:Spore coat protein CotJB n=2 Tax=Sinanaerobacter chloroacetimidivorans TaxID=2818044 RepID=A0A8J7W2T3_9FIRM|nr:spore coat protein CotJB [Sinanaerobacter chloroacetimidivorans]
MDRRSELFQKIQMVSFVLVDTNLYLDTHPDDRAALNYYHKYRTLMDQMVQEYTDNYGPLTPYTVKSADMWTWIDQPWPWEKEANSYVELR